MRMKYMTRDGCVDATNARAPLIIDACATKHKLRKTMTWKTVNMESDLMASNHI